MIFHSRWDVVFILFGLLSFCVACGGGGDDDASDDAADDAIAVDDSGDDDIGDDVLDDTGDDTGDDSQDDDTVEYSLHLSPYPGDASHYGIICGDGFAYFLDENGMTERPDVNGYYLRCGAFDPETYFLLRQTASGPMATVDVVEGSNVTDLNLNQVFDSVYSFDEMPFVFFSRDFGYAGPFEYDNGVWTNLNFFSWNPRGPHDGVVIGEDGCLKTWDGAALTTVACAEDHPLNANPEENYFFQSVRYLGPDKIWVNILGNYSTPTYFSLWSGSGWTATQEAMGTAESYKFTWRVRSADTGAAIVQEVWSDKKGTKEIFDRNYFRLIDNAWAQLDGPKPVPDDPREECIRASAVSSHEAWFICRHYFVPSDQYDNLGPYEDYLAQWIDGVYHYWSFSYPRWPWGLDIDIKVVP